MKSRLIRLSNELRESYWFIPTLMAIGALLLALGMVCIDSHSGSTWVDSLPWLYGARPDGARSLLSAIGGSMIGVAGTTFSVIIAAVVVYASGQYGPRLLSNFMPTGKTIASHHSVKKSSGWRDVESVHPLFPQTLMAKSPTPNCSATGRMRTPCWPTPKATSCTWVVQRIPAPRGIIPTLKAAAEEIRSRIAFWKVVTVG
ncbi:DUF2254 family protein [Sphingomonas sp. 1P06PA]|uniref:DUF2254 family protein n=1 Tax=Sphingomonas sp. 1P06PA TaxID=554121 RepID=UPI0039A75ABD